MTGMRFAPKGYGGNRRSPDQVKCEGWLEQGLLAVAVDDERLSWPERELVRRLGERLYGSGARRRPMGEWTRAQVEDRLESAAEVMRALPGVKPQGYFSTWPEYFHTFADKVGQQPEMRRPLPSPRAITEAEEAMLWLRWLDPEIARLVWARVCRTEWKPICWRFGISRATAHRRWEYGLSVIVWRLNGRRVPTRRSRRYVVEGAVESRAVVHLAVCQAKSSP